MRPRNALACHTFNKGGPNRVGPNLWGLVNRPKASEAGFNYSAAMKGKGGEWTYDDLNKYLANPKAFVPGTNMQFAGLNRGSERADLINYLHTLADNPVPLPKAAKRRSNKALVRMNDCHAAGRCPAASLFVELSRFAGSPLQASRKTLCCGTIACKFCVMGRSAMADIQKAT